MDKIKISEDLINKTLVPYRGEYRKKLKELIDDLEPQNQEVVNITWVKRRRTIINLIEAIKESGILQESPEGAWGLEEAFIIKNFIFITRSIAHKFPKEICIKEMWGYLEGIDRCNKAIARVIEDTYGFCPMCWADLPKKVLAENPATELCNDCKEDSSSLPPIFNKKS